jgi:hypothetical protein
MLFSIELNLHGKMREYSEAPLRKMKRKMGLKGA